MTWQENMDIYKGIEAIEIFIKEKTPQLSFDYKI